MSVNRFQSSRRLLKNTHYLAYMAIFIALKVVTSTTAIPVAENLKVGIGFVIVAIEASILGPVAGPISAAITDIVGFAMFPDGPFFAGYTLTAVLGSMIYSLFLYKKEITVLRITFAKVLNNYLVNVLLGSLWSSMLYGKAYYVYFLRSLTKNTILLPLEIILLVIVFNVLIPLLKKRDLIPSSQKTPVSFK